MTTLIHVGEAPPPFAATADLFDGRTARRRAARLTVDEAASTLVVAVDGQPDRHWRLADLRVLPDHADEETLVLSHRGDRITRLYLTDAAARRGLAVRAPDLYRRPPQARGTRRLLAWAAAAVASVALIIFVLVPAMANQLAEYLPPEGEKALGDQTFEQIRSALSENDFLPLELCDAPAGSAALAQAIAAKVGASPASAQAMLASLSPAKSTTLPSLMRMQLQRHCVTELPAVTAQSYDTPASGLGTLQPAGFGTIRGPAIAIAATEVAGDPALGLAASFLPPPAKGPRR